MYSRPHCEKWKVRKSWRWHDEFHELVCALQFLPHNWTILIQSTSKEIVQLSVLIEYLDTVLQRTCKYPFIFCIECKLFQITKYIKIFNVCTMGAVKLGPWSTLNKFQGPFTILKALVLWWCFITGKKMEYLKYISLNFGQECTNPVRH